MTGKFIPKIGRILLSRHYNIINYNRHHVKHTIRYVVSSKLRSQESRNAETETRQEGQEQLNNFPTLQNNDFKNGNSGSQNKILNLESPQSQFGNLSVHSTWLRHQCRCASCFNHVTFQTNVKLSEELLNSEPIKIQLENLNQLSVIWNDNHESQYDMNSLRNQASTWLNQNTRNNLRRIQSQFKPPFPESSSSSSSSLQFDLTLENSVDFHEFMSSEAGLTQVLRKIYHDGYSIVNNSPVNVESTELAVERITHMQRTMFASGASVVDSKQLFEHKDTAYSSEALELHTDNTYFDEPMGLEVFHCLKHEGTGGLSTFADGFAAAQILHDSKPECYKILATTPVLLEYFDPGKQFYSCVDTILGHNKFSGVLEKIKFNMSDMRSPVHIPVEQFTPFYSSMFEYSKILNSTRKSIKLNPGTIIFFNNWRLLHGRTEFSGSRILVTIYAGRSDWLSKARVFGILEN